MADSEERGPGYTFVKPGIKVSEMVPLQFADGALENLIEEQPLGQNDLEAGQICKIPGQQGAFAITVDPEGQRVFQVYSVARVSYGEKEYFPSFTLKEEYSLPEECDFALGEWDTAKKDLEPYERPVAAQAVPTDDPASPARDASLEQPEQGAEEPAAVAEPASAPQPQSEQAPEPEQMPFSFFSTHTGHADMEIDVTVIEATHADTLEVVLPDHHINTTLAVMDEQRAASPER